MIAKVTRLIQDALSAVKRSNDETALLALGAMLSKQQLLQSSTNINDYEFKIFSQWGDDGIIQYLVRNLSIENEQFIEFGVEDYSESNTRFLMMHNNWSGFVMDGSAKAMQRLRNRRWFWKYDLRCQDVFIDRDNINGLLAATGFRNIGLLHIDLDGNDYHILQEINLAVLNPAIIIMEYNSVFGKERPISTPYDKHFIRTKAHYSNLFFGASLPALDHLARQKGYALVGGNLAGNNAYFVRRDLLNDRVREVSVATAFRESRFREGRNRNYSLSYLSGKERLEAMRGLEVLNVVSGQLEQL